MNKFLPISKKDLDLRGIKQLDFVYVIGDAYVDHPSFGHAIISVSYTHLDVYKRQLLQTVRCLV